MWAQGRLEVMRTFFNDRIEIFECSYIQDELNEVMEQLVSIGAYYCNIQNGVSSLKDTISTQAVPQTIRVSLDKNTPLLYNKVYKLRILEARLFHTEELWRVDGWTEAQLSTVMTASREVRA